MSPLTATDAPRGNTMTTRSKSFLRRALAIGSLVAVMGVAPAVVKDQAQVAIAQTANFPGLSISFPPRDARVNGRTTGTYSLANIARTDKNGNPCVGFGDSNPDHIIILETDFPTLRLTVDSGQDTTLLVQGPNDNTIRCGQDISRSNPDAQISDTNLPAGTYRVWVGSHNQGQRFSYTLSATE